MKFTTCFVGAIGSARTAPPPNSSTADWLLRTNGNKLVSCCRRPYALIRSGGKCDCPMHVMPSYRGINLRITFSIWLILLSACLRWQKSGVKPPHSLKERGFQRASRSKGRRGDRKHSCQLVFIRG